MGPGTGEEEVRAISRVLDTIETAGDRSRVTVADILARLGGRSFAPVLLVPALLMVSPLSTIPGTPTLSALIIGLIAAQMLVGRQTLWLPDFVQRRTISRARMEKAVAFLRKPARWTETRMRRRLVFLAEGPGSLAALLVCLAITLVMPLMEFVPALATIAAIAISLIAAGLLARDGALVVAGYAVVIAAVLVARTFILGAAGA